MPTKFKILIGFLVTCLAVGPGLYMQGQETKTAQVHVTAVIRGYVVFLLDATDAGNSVPLGNYSIHEDMVIGNVDAGGTPTSGGDAMLLNISGIPVKADGNPSLGLLDSNCIGSFYPFFFASGGDTQDNHPASAVGMKALSPNAWTSWAITVAAQLVNANAGVAIDQLKWKADATASAGFEGYTPFGIASTPVTSGLGPIDLLTFYDYGLLVEFTDTTHPSNQNEWLVTYTLAYS